VNLLVWEICDLTNVKFGLIWYETTKREMSYHLRVEFTFKDFKIKSY
jgi:hypothetical protein